MATRVDLAIEGVRTALETQLASLKRMANTTKQPAFKPIIQKDIAAIQAAIGTLSETK